MKRPIPAINTANSAKNDGKPDDIAIRRRQTREDLATNTHRGSALRC